jgi:hypothetical protein
VFCKWLQSQTSAALIADLKSSEEGGGNFECRETYAEGMAKAK